MQITNYQRQLTAIKEPTIGQTERILYDSFRNGITSKVLFMIGNVKLYKILAFRDRILVIRIVKKINLRVLRRRKALVTFIRKSYTICVFILDILENIEFRDFLRESTSLFVKKFT